MKKVLTLLVALWMAAASSQYTSGAATQCDCQRLYEVYAETKEGLRYGFIDCRGKVVLEPAFLSAEDFSDGVAVVNVEQRVVGHREDGHAAYEITDGIVGVDGNLVTLPGTNIISSFSEGLALAKVRDKFVYLDRSGKVAISIPDNIKLADVDYSPPGEYHFHDGVAGLRAEGGGIYLIDKQGAITLSKEPFYRYDESGLAIVDVKDQKAIVNREGRYIFGPQRNEIEGSEGIYFTVPKGKKEKYKFLNNRGELLFERSFDEVGLFSEGLAKVKAQGKWGYMDKSGHLRIPHLFDDARDFAEGLAGVKTKGRWGFINPYGTFAIPPEFKSVTDFECGLVYVQRSGDGEYIDKKGMSVWKESKRRA